MVILDVSLLRYHLSPHSAYPVGVGSFTEQRIQAAGDFDHDPAGAGGTAKNGHGFDKLSHGLRGFRIAAANLSLSEIQDG